MADESADFLNELLMWAHLRHPNLTMFLGACTASSPMIVVSEHMPGGTVEHRLLHSPSAPLYLLQRWVLELARAVCFLHNCNPPVLHRRILPSNLLLSGDDHLSLTHFAASQFLPRRRHGSSRKDRRPGRADAPSVCEARVQSLGAEHGAEGRYDRRYAAPETLRDGYQWDDKVRRPHAPRTLGIRGFQSAPAACAGHARACAGPSDMGPARVQGDVYSYGMVVYFMAAQRHPLDALPPDEAAARLAQAPSVRSPP